MAVHEVWVAVVDDVPAHSGVRLDPEQVDPSCKSTAQKTIPNSAPSRRFYRICGVVWFIMHPAMIYFAGVLAGFSIGRQQVASIGIGLPRRGRRGRDSRRGGRDWTRSSCPGRSSVRNPRPGSASSQRARRREQAARNGMHGMIGPSRRRRRRD